MSSGEAELGLVNKVELKLILAKDDKLGSLLGVYLCPLLLKLNSPHETVRKKVVEICQHIDERLRSRYVYGAINQPITNIYSSIELPIEALINQFKDPTITGNKYMMQTFDLMYIKKALKQDKVSINYSIEHYNSFIV
ncbi:hypothetical protein TRICI_002177 [Trichomonascus ciferrii]|uniref:Proteasome component Ecm29 N-terminal domain-containing protein n=1 Tax=Trichomonascus ciferrii TaxID=44093 RepID=A0A642V7K2_9ASCO|nr:hypothetical protein TRICI_002177 [Trichomonascus ciferrii]